MKDISVKTEQLEIDKRYWLDDSKVVSAICVQVDLDKKLALFDFIEGISCYVKNDDELTPFVDGEFYEIESSEGVTSVKEEVKQARPSEITKEQEKKIADKISNG